MTVRFVGGWEKVRLELGLGVRLLGAALRRFGVWGAFREIVGYLLDNKNLFAGQGRYLVARDADVYAVSALPPVASPRFLDYVLDELYAFNHRQPAPLAWVLLAASSRCPYRCDYCYALDELSRTDQALSLEVLTRTIGEIRDLGVPTIFLTGGEMGLRKDEIPAMLGAGKGGPAFWLVTTGWGVDASLLQDLAARGLVGIVVSLDAADEPHTVDAKKHPKAFENALSAIHAAHDAGLMVSIDTMVPHGSPLLTDAGFTAFVDFLGSQGAHFLNLFPPHPIGAARKAGLKTLTADDVQTLDRLTAASIRRREKVPLAYAAIAWEAKRGCAGGQQFVYVDPRGDVRPCPFLAYSAGNIRDRSIAEIIRGMRQKGEQEGCFHAYPGLEGWKRVRPPGDG